MNENTQTKPMSHEEVDSLYNNEYIKGVHKIGTATMLILLLVSFMPAMYLSFFRGMHPGWDVIAKAALALVGINVFQWILEPVMYFPMIGITGSYIGFVAGNITPMRIPAAVAAQSAVEAKPGSKKGEFAGVIGIVSSVVVNFVVLAVVIVFGTYLVSILPDGVNNALQYALPGVYGALLVTFIARLKM